MATAEAHSEDRRREQELLGSLLREKQIERYGLFGVSGEGQELANGIESASGYVVDATGLVHSFWLDYDRKREQFYFRRWREVKPSSDWADDAEYQRARKSAGLV